MSKRVSSNAIVPEVASEHNFDSSKGVVFEEFKKSKYAVETNPDDLPLLQRINWLSTSIIGVPLISAIVGMCLVTPHLYTVIFTAIWYFCCACGITMGYHRLWSHRAYSASAPLEFLLAGFGAAALQGSARWWSRQHRVHHRYVDTEKDPYGVHRGFWFAHMGWMVFKQDARRYGRVDMSDLNANKILRFQHENYLKIAILVAVVIPLAVCTLGWGDFKGGFVYAVMLRIATLHQATFCINSVAHYWGDQVFTTGHSAKDSLLCAILTNGEGYHNFHHEFPHDYRNAVTWYQYDPTKWVIAVCAKLGLAHSLNAVTDNEILKAKAQVLAIQVEWANKDVSKLEPWTKDRLYAEAKEKGRMVLAIYQRVIELPHSFVEHHPGGASILKFWMGKDATDAFNGDVYNHAKGARNLLNEYTIGFYPEGQVETFKGDGRDPITMSVPSQSEVQRLRIEYIKAQKAAEIAARQGLIQNGVAPIYRKEKTGSVDGKPAAAEEEAVAGAA